jgi:hypothetical protein
MSTGNGSISENDLMKKLVQAKKVMNKVDGGNFERGQIDERVLLSNPEEMIINESPTVSGNQTTPQYSVDRINNSKLPDAIKKAMIENPIPTISLTDTLDMNFIKGAKRLMEQEGVSSKKSTPQPTKVNVPTSNIDMNSLSVLIENTIRKVLDEKLNQILTAQQTTTINENLVLKVGDSIFKGKITGVNKTK